MCLTALCLPPPRAEQSHVTFPGVGMGWGCSWTIHSAPWGLSSGLELDMEVALLRTQSMTSFQTPGQSFSLLHEHSPPLLTLPRCLILLDPSALPSFLPPRSTEHHPFLQGWPGHSQSSFGHRKPGLEMGNLVFSTRRERRAGG